MLENQKILDERKALNPLDCLSNGSSHRPCYQHCRDFPPNRMWGCRDQEGIECLSCNGDGMGRISDYPSHYFLLNSLSCENTQLDCFWRTDLNANMLEQNPNNLFFYAVPHCLSITPRSSVTKLVLKSSSSTWDEKRQKTNFQFWRTIHRLKSRKIPSCGWKKKVGVHI